nr:MAG TPA: hypothetical protein [Caudoviricetes sp.]
MAWKFNIFQHKNIKKPCPKPCTFSALSLHLKSPRTC